MSPAAYLELPVFYASGRDTLFGILTLPQDGCARSALIVFPGGGAPFTMSRNRVSVRICREVASLGWAAFRTDYHGAGDSGGTWEKLFTGRPFTDDGCAAARTIRAMGAERLVLAGSCFGGRTALAAAAQDENVDALVLIAAPLNDFEMGHRKSVRAAQSWSMGRYVRESLHLRRIRGLFDARSRKNYRKYARAKFDRMPTWRRLSGGSAPLVEESIEVVSPVFEEPLRQFLGRGGRVLFVFGEGDSAYEEYKEAAAGPMADILGGGHEGVELTVLPGRLHGFLSIASQDGVVEEIARWAATDPPAAASPMMSAVTSHAVAPGPSEGGLGSVRRDEA